MSDIKIYYILFKTIELILFVILGFYMSRSKTNIQYWKYAISTICIYGIVEGLRFGRMVDWNLYYFRYNSLGENINLEEYEPLFEYICHFLYNIGIPYYGFIFLQCTLFITTSLVLFKPYKRYMSYILPIFLTITWSNEQFIRWYLAFSFLLVAITMITVNRNTKAYIWFVCACLCHSGIVLFLPILLFYNIINEQRIHFTVAIIALFFTSFLMSLTGFHFITSIADVIKIFITDEKITYYLNSIELLLSGEWGNVGYIEMSTFYYIRGFISCAPIIYFGYRIMPQHNGGVCIYNLFVIGAILNPLFSQIEIFNRYSFALLFFQSIVGGTVFYEIFKRKKNLISLLICLISCICTIQPVITDMFRRQKDTEMMFIWQSNGREYIP